MVEQTMDLIIVTNAIILIILVAGIRRWQKDHGRKIGERGLAMILSGYFSFSAITTLIPLLKINPRVTVIVALVFLLLFWLVGYPWIRWLYRHINPAK